MTMQQNAAVLKGMKLAPGVVNPKGVILSAGQVADLRTAVAEHKEPDVLATCYAPRNALLFYRQGTPVAYVEICFDCRNSHVVPSIGSAGVINLVRAAKLVEELKLPVGKYQSAAEFKAQYEHIQRIQRRDVRDKE